MTRDKDIGKILRSRRLELGMTQEQVALKLGMSIHQYQRYEYGEHRFPEARDEHSPIPALRIRRAQVSEYSDENRASGLHRA